MNETQYIIRIVRYEKRNNQETTTESYVEYTSEGHPSIVTTEDRNKALILDSEEAETLFKLCLRYELAQTLFNTGYKGLKRFNLKVDIVEYE